MISTILIHDDSIKRLTAKAGFREATDGSGKVLKADACITDPPYGIDFSGEGEWDDFKIDRLDHPNRAFEQWCKLWTSPLFLDVLWPGAHIAGFSGYTSVHRLACGIEDVGFEIRTPMAWLHMKGQLRNHHNLMPVFEPICIGRKPVPADTNAKQLFERTGRGMLHTDAIRTEGRCPVNIEIADATVLDANLYDDAIDKAIAKAAKFFYVTKASKADREYGCDELPEREIQGSAENNMRGAKEGAKSRNTHPTVKPIDLMRRLVRLLTKPGATIIDPFMGSGTTGVAAVLEGRNFIGIEREAEFFAIASARIAHAKEEFEASIAA